MAKAAAMPVAAKLAVAGATAFLGLVLLVGMLAPISAGQVEGEQCQVRLSGNGSSGLLPRYVPMYEKAAARYRLGPRGFGVLAGIHKIETDFGRLEAPGVTSGENSAGAGGPMQFLAPTWASYGVDANGDGRADRYQPADAIHAAANYLRASGAPADWRRAIFAYNHADWYVDDVLANAERFGGATVVCEPAGGLGGQSLGRIDWTDTSGAWGGSKKFADLALRLARRYGCDFTSAKRSTQSTASGGTSDHWIGSTTAYAYDISDSTCSREKLDQFARELAVVFRLPGHEGVVSATRGTYRVQLLWKTYVGGDHFNHVHIGIRRWS
ncbi:MAG: lytic transglycosylase domain-containing protein [Solirubrobacterales bacterium]